MISEHKFSSGYTSFWRAVLPLGDPFVRRMNNNLKKFAEPYSFDAPAERSALLSELSYRLFLSDRSAKRSLLGFESSEPDVIQEMASEAAEYLSQLKGAPLISGELREGESRIALGLAERLRLFFLAEGSMGLLTPAPRFEGCGIIDSCKGDVLVGAVLYEIKNVERTFRLVDVRQVLTYCALNHAKELHRIAGVGWVNARSGKFFKLGLDTIAMSAAGVPAHELLSEIVSFISTDYASR